MALRAFLAELAFMHLRLGVALGAGLGRALEDVIDMAGRTIDSFVLARELECGHFVVEILFQPGYALAGALPGSGGMAVRAVGAKFPFVDHRFGMAGGAG